MNIVFQNRTYDILKWLTLIAIPAFAVFYSVIANIWGWPYGDEVSFTCNAVCAFLGALIGISTANYNKSEMK